MAHFSKKCHYKEQAPKSIEKYDASLLKSRKIN